ncbi:hypothetical protein RRG08_045331 [Elysia crispata]|uniref:Uncharacterized protein n=1 Tax=Elysia crispata TaxID=231223 RepID=A0AAE1A2S7_9GAST|nr:hypothetical protein RRG08_045331 [Elysia crispata]
MNNFHAYSYTDEFGSHFYKINRPQSRALDDGSAARLGHVPAVELVPGHAAPAFGNTAAWGQAHTRSRLAISHARPRVPLTLASEIVKVNRCPYVMDTSDHVVPNGPLVVADRNMERHAKSSRLESQPRP